MEEVVVIKPVRDADACTQCGICETFCPSICITVGDDEERWFDYRCCKGCNMCATICPEEAIEMIMATEEVAS